MKAGRILGVEDEPKMAGGRGQGPRVRVLLPVRQP